MEIDELYQDLILDHFKHPRHSRRLTDSEVLVDEENPTCGDHIRLAATVDRQLLTDVVIDCEGCAICTASASMMSERVIGKPVADVRALATRFIELMRGRAVMTDEELGDLVALKGVARYPLRVKCATMSGHALDSALNRLEGRS